MTLGRRADEDLLAGLRAWWGDRHPGGRETLGSLERPSSGWSNETVLVTATRGGGEVGLVVRMPTVVPSFPEYDLAAQATVQRALLDAGVPAARPVAVELDERWLGCPFLVMERARGHSVGDAPALDRWLAGAGTTTQRRVHDGFLSVLDAVHTLTWEPAGLGSALRGATSSLVDEVSWWIRYIGWAAEGEPAPPRLVALARWCADHAPAAAPPASLCWGDARPGNLLFDEDGEVTAALDWELACIGPAEMDVAWYLAMDEVATSFIKRGVPGFHDREGVVREVESRLGRPLVDLRWHEVFALVRAAAINDRQARIAARVGASYPGVAGDDNPLLGFGERIAAELESGA